MESAIQQEKVMLLFKQLDTDADGFIDRRDVSALAQRILSGVGEDGDSPKGRELLSAFDQVWEQLARDADADRDGRVSREEFTQGMRAGQLTSQDAYDRYFHPGVAAAYRVIDRDGDGVVSRAEFGALQQAFGTPADQVDQIFGQFDTDGNGLLDATETTRHARDFYLSTDPSAAGNGLFGPLPA
ncbi:EF-hand domain-containing protein [Streptomyces hyderabadensis]|uniref:EF-hand domain-containing protein n=1 Tax=Streptomyces hyderabadensis TaxID=598549 RepID=A0ABP9IYD5_9ACTN|nr:EF-hand domain-containing protein [Streptomyces hyderabadensis]